MSHNLAGSDVHEKVVMVVVVDTHDPDAKPERRRFLTMPEDLHQLSVWLQDRSVEEVVMESTALYWRSVWMELEPHMRLHLAQAYSNRAPRGPEARLQGCRTTGAATHSQGLILSFVPGEEQWIWRNLSRMRLQLVRDRVRLHGQIECLLEGAHGTGRNRWRESGEARRHQAP